METQTEKKEIGIIEFFNDLWKSFVTGDAPNLDDNFIVDGIEPSRGLKQRITRRANIILEQNGAKNHKFGKSGQPPQRIDWDDYREAPYTKMFLL